MESLSDINDVLNRIINTPKEQYNDESDIDCYVEKYESSTSKEFKKAKEDYLKIKFFKKEVENLKGDENNLRELFREIVDKGYYKIADFLVTKTDVDASDLFDLFIEKNSNKFFDLFNLFIGKNRFSDKIGSLLKSKEESKINVGLGILIRCVEKNKNLKSVEDLFNNVIITNNDLFYELCKFTYINKCPNAIDFLIDKALSTEFKEARLRDLIENAVENNNLELLKELFNKEKLINNIKNFDKVIDGIFKREDINAINILLQNKLLNLNLKSLREEHKLFLLEHFSKNDSPEELKQKVISEILNKEEYICKDVNIFGTQQGYGQVNLNKIFKYDERSRIIIENDEGYSKYARNSNIKSELLYKIKYLENGEKQITYFEKGSNGSKELITAKIKTNNEIIFDTKNINYSLEQFQAKVSEILEDDYAGIDKFDYSLSYLIYAPLQLQQQNKNNRNNLVFITNCEDIGTIKNIINKEEYKNKTVICDFRYDDHNVQIVICNKKVTIINTLDSKNQYNWKVLEKIKARFNEEMDVKEIFISHRKPKNCVEASKLSAIALAMQFSNDFKNFSELNERLNKLEGIFEEVSKLSEIKNLTVEEKNKKQIDYINSNLTDEEYKENFKLLMTILNSNQQLFLHKSRHFGNLQYKFIKFKDNFIKARSKIEISEDEKEFIENMRKPLIGILKGLSTKDVIDFFYGNKSYGGIDAKVYSYKNPYNSKDYEINGKMKFLLISIKSGNIGSVSNYMNELKEYVKNDKNLIKENIQNIIDTNFRLENNMYTEEVIKRFNEEIRKIEKMETMKKSEEVKKVEKIETAEKTEETKDIVIKDKNADLIRTDLEKSSKDLFSTLMDKTHNQHNSADHYITIESPSKYESKPSLWQRTKTFFTKTIPNFFRKVFGNKNSITKLNENNSEKIFTDAAKTQEKGQTNEIGTNIRANSQNQTQQIRR